MSYFYFLPGLREGVCAATLTEVPSSVPFTIATVLSVVGFVILTISPSKYGIDEVAAKLIFEQVVR
jgi:hypothetical protein